MKIVTAEGEDATVPASRVEKKRRAKSHISSCLCNSRAGRIGDKMITKRVKCISQRKSLLFQSYFNLLKARLRVAAFPHAAHA